MADFNLAVEMTARTDKLDAAFKQAQAGADRTATKIEKAGSAGKAGLGKIAVAGAAVLGSISALEIGFGAAGAAVALFSGDTEKMKASLQSLPMIGGLITKMFELGDALEYASTEAQRSRASFFELEQSAKDLNTTLGSLSAELTLMQTVMEKQGQDELAIANRVHAKKTRLIRLEFKQKRQEIKDAYGEELQAIHDLNTEEEIATRLYEEARQKKYQRVRDLEENIKLQEELNNLERQEVFEKTEEKMKKEAEAAKQAAEAKEKAEREAFQKEMEDIALRQAAEMEGVARIERERKAAAKRVAEEEKKRQEELAAKQKAEKEKMAEIEKKIAEETAAAEASVRGATGTFDTAGGSFTTGIAAQVDQSKILNKLSQESRDFLEQIVQNTARMVGVERGFA
jgi:chromosome segregation ATPase